MFIVGKCYVEFKIVKKVSIYRKKSFNKKKEMLAEKNAVISIVWPHSRSC